MVGWLVSEWGNYYLPDGNDACEEIDHFDGVAALTVEKV